MRSFVDNTMNITKMGVHNFTFRGIELEDIFDVLDDKEVRLYSRFHEKHFIGTLHVSKRRIRLTWKNKFSPEMASRLGCVPLNYAPADATISYVKSEKCYSKGAWDNCDAILLPERDDEGKQVVYDHKKDTHYWVEMRAPTEWDNKCYLYGYRIIAGY